MARSARTVAALKEAIKAPREAGLRDVVSRLQSIAAKLQVSNDNKSEETCSR
jgi:hypothetical protein